MREVTRHAPSNFVTHREDVPLRMKMLPHAHLAQLDNGHDTDVEGKDGLAFPVTRHGWNAVTLGDHGVRLQTFWLRVSLYL